MFKLVDTDEPHNLTLVEFDTSERGSPHCSEN